ncbi:hypothetical protein DL93DRAFT_2030740, partial [Clavulina sp. PMI_390]
ANHLPPRIQPSKRLVNLPPRPFACLIQCCTGHAHIGSYYDYFHIPEPHACPCGTFQTHNHILLNCPLHNRHHHLLKDNKGKIELNNILRTNKGCMRLVQFIRASQAFEKTTAHI